MRCISSSPRRLASRTTPAGLPPSGVSVNAVYRSASVIPRWCQTARVVRLVDQRSARLLSLLNDGQQGASSMSATAPREKAFLLAVPEQRVLEAIARRLPRAVHPDHLTTLALAAAVGFAVAAATGRF